LTKKIFSFIIKKIGEKTMIRNYKKRKPSNKLPLQEFKSKVVFEFDYFEDKSEIEKVTKVDDLISVINEMKSFLRSKIKYDSSLTSEQIGLYEDVREVLFEIINNKDVSNILER